MEFSFVIHTMRDPTLSKVSLFAIVQHLNSFEEIAQRLIHLIRLL